MEASAIFSSATGGIGVTAYLALSAVLFGIGAIGVVLNRRNLVITLLSLEIMVLAAAINLAVFSVEAADRSGEIILLGSLAVVAAKAAIGVALVICLYRNRGSAAVTDLNLLRG